MGIASISLPQKLSIKLVEHYQSLSEKYLTEARELLKAGDLVQASEKFWGCFCTGSEGYCSEERAKAGATWKF